MFDPGLFDPSLFVVAGFGPTQYFDCAYFDDTYFDVSDTCGEDPQVVLAATQGALISTYLPPVDPDELLAII